MAGRYEIRCRRHRLWGYYPWDQFQRHQRKHAQEEALRRAQDRLRQDQAARKRAARAAKAARQAQKNLQKGKGAAASHKKGKGAA